MAKQRRPENVRRIRQGGHYLKGVSVDALSSAIGDILAGYEEEVADVVSEISRGIAYEAVGKLKISSPKLSGKYEKSWDVKEQMYYNGVSSFVIHNKKHYRKTHVLENGHANRDGSRTKAQPHIGDVEQWAIEEIEKRVIKGLNVDI